jgi:hypothetical protein
LDSRRPPSRRSRSRSPSGTRGDFGAAALASFHAAELPCLPHLTHAPPSRSSASARKLEAAGGNGKGNAFGLARGAAANASASGGASGNASANASAAASVNASEPEIFYGEGGFIYAFSLCADVSECARSSNVLCVKAAPGDAVGACKCECSLGIDRQRRHWSSRKKKNANPN